MLASNVLHRIPGSVEITSTNDVLFEARVDDEKHNQMFRIFSLPGLYAAYTCRLSQVKTTLENLKHSSYEFLHNIFGGQRIATTQLRSSDKLAEHGHQ